MIEKQIVSGSKASNRPERQRALVLQGGGALGAYEVGAIRGLYETLTKRQVKNEPGEDSKAPLFDIIAGTSIGAMNASVLIGNVLKGNSWKDAIVELEKFWTEGIALKEGLDRINDDIPPKVNFSMYPWWKPWTKEIRNWEPDRKKIVSIASEEAARRYYSTKVFVSEAGKVFSLKDRRDDNKFFDPLAIRFMLNEEPLKKLIEKFGKFPIGTCIDKGEPRLLVTAVDIAEGITVTFDSYKKSDGKRKTVYRPGQKYKRTKNSKCFDRKEDDSNQIVIEYDKGIQIDHIMASGTLPETYDPIEICNRSFWDGGLLSNTPLRELLDAHRDYWVNVENQCEAPDLEVYVVNVHPSTIDVANIPKHLDEVKDRNNDIVYGDRTYNDQYSASLATDYIDFMGRLRKIAESHIKDSEREEFKSEFESLESEPATSTSYTSGESRSFKDLMTGQFKLSKVQRIERKYNPESSTYLKLGDITRQTIQDLIKQGRDDVMAL
jgi:predicted acylesterase/phospholipase RssA